MTCLLILSEVLNYIMSIQRIIYHVYPTIALRNKVTLNSKIFSLQFQPTGIRSGDKYSTRPIVIMSEV